MAADKFNLNNIDKSNWKSYRFDEIAINISERVDPNNTDLEVYIGLEHIDSESLHIKRTGTPDDVNGQKLKFYKGDIIFGRRRAYQRKAGIATCDGFCSAHALVLRANTAVINTRLFPFFIHSDAFMNRAVDISVGSLSPTINWGTLKHQEFLVPPKEQQADLSELLWGIDEVIETKIAHLEKSEECLRSYFEAQIERDGKNIRILREVLLNIIAGKSPNASSHPAKPDEFGVLKVSAVGDGVFVESENKALIRNEDFKSEFEVKNGFILVTRANAEKSGVGRPCLVKNTRPGLMLSDKTLRLVPNKNIISERFLFQLLRTKMYRSFVESVAGGTEAKNISQERLYQTPIWCPSLMEQKNIESRLYAFDTAIENVSIALNSSKALQKSLINEVF